MLRCRKNQSTLTPQEKAHFVAALLTLKGNGKYDQYVQMHMNAMMAAHRGPAFLPWHRYYINQLELDLQAIDSSVTLPYWDWTVDQSPLSSLWGPDLMGGNGRPTDGQVTTGPFAFATGNWTLSIDGPALLRRMGVDIATLPTPGDLTAALNATPYDVAPWSMFSSSGFRNMLEGWINGPQLHNRVHVWVGGSMEPMSSPNDPVFFLHHCFIDKLWADWTRLHPGIGYVPISGGPMGHNLNDSMEPWATQGQTVTPASLLDHHALGYAYDNEPECRPKLKFRDDTLKFRDDKRPPFDTLKFRDDKRPIFDTLKFRDDKQPFAETIKFRDDKLAVADPKGKFVDDPLGPTGPAGLPGSVARPFALATPHHSMAWAGTMPPAQQSALAEHQAAVAEYEAMLSEMSDAMQRGELSAEEMAQFDALQAEHGALVAEYEQMLGQGQ